MYIQHTCRSAFVRKRLPSPVGSLLDFDDSGRRNQGEGVISGCFKFRPDICRKFRVARIEEIVVCSNHGPEVIRCERPWLKKPIKFLTLSREVTYCHYPRLRRAGQLWETCRLISDHEVSGMESTEQTRQRHEFATYSPGCHKSHEGHNGCCPDPPCR